MKIIGKCNRQLVEGISPIKYGWVDKNNRKIFFVEMGFHIKVLTTENRLVEKLHSKINKDIGKLTKMKLPEARYSIVDVDIPDTLTRVLRGFVGIELMIHCNDVINEDRIEDYTRSIGDILLSYGNIQVFPNNKY